MADELPNPESRKETYLAKAAGMSIEELPTPASREELYLNAIAENGGGGGGGGTSNFNQLTNRPKYNGDTMTGDTNIPEVKTYTAGTNVTISGTTISATDTTYSDFTGTDGTAAGASGLVPAPATTDAGKFLKADGTWGAAGGGGSDITVLTTADYNYPSGSPEGVNPLALSTGIYKVTNSMSVYINRDAARNPVKSTASGEMYFVVDNDPQTASRVLIFYPVGADLTDSNGEEAIRLLIGTNAGSKITVEHSVLTSQHVVDNLTSTDTLYPLSANQGKVLKGLIDAISQSGSGAPTTSTVGTVGQLYQDTTNGKLYICTDVTGGTYTWAEVGAGGGGGGVTELTSADYNYDPGNTGTNTAVALWLLNPGVYSAENGLLVYLNAALYRTVTVGTFIIGERIISSSNEYVEVVSFIKISGEDSWVNRAEYVSVSNGSFASGVSLGGPTVVQTTGTSTANVMSQNAVTSTIYADPSAKTQLRIGTTQTAGTHSTAVGVDSKANALYSTAYGNGAWATGQHSLALGEAAFVDSSHTGSVAIGSNSSTSGVGEVSINTSNTAQGYNSSNYRLLTGLYDGQSNHDAATVAQGNKLMTVTPTTTNAGVLGQLWTDTTNMHIYQLTAIDDTTDPQNPVYTWTQRW